MNTELLNPAIIQPPQKCLNAIEIAQMYGISKNKIRDTALNDFNISQKLVDYFTVYNLLHWQSEYFFSVVHEGILEKDGIKYIVIYNKCNRFEAKRIDEVMLSFRAPIAEFNIPAYVLVRPKN